MPGRTRKKIHSKRGTRRCGYGNVKNKRGAGCKGGVGGAGLSKHKFTWITRYDPGHFGVPGFARRNAKRAPAINLYELNSMAEKGKLKASGERYAFEFRGKVLGTGELRHALSLKAFAWSKKAEEKIKKAGGEIAKLE